MLVNKDERSVRHYDPMSSSYAAQARNFALAVALMLKEQLKTDYRVRADNSSLGIQSDSYKCEVFVLLFTEEHVSKKPVGHLVSRFYSISAIATCACAYE